MRRAPQHGAQLSLPLEAPPARDAAELLDRLRAAGLSGIDRCRLTRNRSVMVSFRGRELRIHEGYLGAPPEVLQAITVFVGGRTAAARRAARAVILAHPVDRPTRPRRAERTRPEDEGLAATLTEWHGRYNERHFGGELRAVAVRVSRRMRSRLGHYTAACPSSGEAAEIVISRRHIRRHGWQEALHTLLHEMVHQWQDERGHSIDHGRIFRAKARELGITASARRTIQPAQTRGTRAPTLSPRHLTLKAAREE